jgi:hypothetical protein
MFVAECGYLAPCSVELPDHLVDVHPSAYWLRRGMPILCTSGKFKRRQLEGFHPWRSKLRGSFWQAQFSVDKSLRFKFHSATVPGRMLMAEGYPSSWPNVPPIQFFE